MTSLSILAQKKLCTHSWCRVSQFNHKSGSAAAVLTTCNLNDEFTIGQTVTPSTFNYYIQYFSACAIFFYKFSEIRMIKNENSLH